MKRSNDFSSGEFSGRKIQKVDFSDDPMKEFEIETEENVRDIFCRFEYFFHLRMTNCKGG